jgi:hypothetical protein
VKRKGKKQTKGEGGGGEAIKEKKSKIKILAHELVASTLLSNAKSLVISQSFKSLFTDFSYVKVGIPLPLFITGSTY